MKYANCDGKSSFAWRCVRLWWFGENASTTIIIPTDKVRIGFLFLTIFGSDTDSCAADQTGLKLNISMGNFPGKNIYYFDVSL